MSERSKLISRLLASAQVRASYIRSKLNVNIPAQIKALRLRRDMTQAEVGEAAEMKQSRISAMEKPGASNFNIETLVRLASVFNVGLVVKFAPFSEMLEWDNSFYPDNFNVIPLSQDQNFLEPQSPRGLQNSTFHSPNPSNFYLAEFAGVEDAAAQHATRGCLPIPIHAEPQQMQQIVGL